MGLTQIEPVWVRVLSKMAESKMTEFKMAEFKMAAIIKLSQNEWVKFFICKCWEIILAGVSEFERKNYDGWIQDGQYSRWQNSRWLPSSSWVRMNEWSIFCANGGNQSWQVWVSLRGHTKMDESKMAVEFKLAEFKMAAIIKLSQKEWVWSLN